MKTDVSQATAINHTLQRAVEEAMYSLIMDSLEACWYFILCRMNFREDNDTEFIRLKLLNTGEICIGLNFNRYIMLSFDARKALLKHICIRYIYGHLSSYGAKLKKFYVGGLR